MGKIEQALGDLRSGKFILLHDSSGRENETDFVVAAEHVKPKHVAAMSRDAGGLICVAIDGPIAEEIGLPFLYRLHEAASREYPLLKASEADDIPYDERSSFSITVNHRDTFTGVSDKDRALTISELGKLCNNSPTLENFGVKFRSPGHVHLLISSGLDKREGHTELSVELMRMAGLTPVAVVCEMLDHESFNSLSREKAIKYATEKNMVFLEVNEVKNAWLNSRGSRQ